MKKFRFTRKEKVWLLLSLLILLALFVSSSMTYRQQEMDSAVVNHRFGWLEPLIKNWNIYYAGTWHNRVADHGLAAFTQFFVRKLAHFGSYFLLGMFSYLGLRRLFVVRATAPFFVWFMTVAFAALDEYHQYLTGDRTPSVHDVMLDGIGSLIAIVICVCVFYFCKKLKKSRV